MPSSLAASAESAESSYLQADGGGGMDSGDRASHWRCPHFWRLE